MFFPLLQFLFIALKLTVVIAWSWWLVLLPAIIGILIHIIVAVLIACGVCTVKEDVEIYKKEWIRHNLRGGRR